MDFQNHAAAFEQLGFRLAALSVDSPPRSAKLRRDLGLTFPLLCDPQRQAVRAWGQLNPHRRGGIAVPATAVIAPDGFIRLWVKEAVAQRLGAANLLEYVSSNASTAPARRSFWPGTRDWWRAFFH